jgi:hypothetical protein
VGNHQIPALVENLLDWLLQMPTGIGLALEQIATPCVMAMAAEGITHSAAVFAGDKDSHQ